MRELLLTSRPLSWVNTAYPFAAAYVLAAGHIDWPLVVGTVFFLVPYNLAMYGINDVFDYESDLLNPRKGGVEGAVVDRGRHRGILVAAIVGCIPFVVVLLSQGTAAANLFLVAALFAVVAYSAPKLRFKERPFVDSVTSSSHFVLPAAYGLALAHASFGGGIWAFLGAYFLWGMASHAFGAVQDIQPDRQAGIASIGTVLGARNTVLFSAGAYTVAGLLMLGTALPWGALLALPYLANVAPFLRVTDASSSLANAGWRRFLVLNYVTGFLVTMLLIWYAMDR